MDTNCVAELLVIHCNLIVLLMENNATNHLKVSFSSVLGKNLEGYVWCVNEKLHLEHFKSIGKVEHELKSSINTKIRSTNGALDLLIESKATLQISL